MPSGFAIADVVLGSIGFILGIFYWLLNFYAQWEKISSSKKTGLGLGVLFSLSINVSAIVYGALAIAHPESEQFQNSAIVLFWVIVGLDSLCVIIVAITCCCICCCFVAVAATADED